MIFRRALGIVLWTGLMVALWFGTAFATLMGDCPEKIIPNWQEHICTDQKHLAAMVIMIGFPLAWLAGSVTIARFRRS